jgi:hypothetical protein
MHAHANAPATPPETPWRAALRGLAGQLRVGIPLCTVVAVFMTLVFSDPFGRTLVFSLCIGLSIQLFIHAGRLIGTRRLVARGVFNESLRSQWPGWGWMGPWVAGSAVGGYLFGKFLAGLLTGMPLHDSGPHSPRALAIVLVVCVLVAVFTTDFFLTRGRLAGMEAAAQAARRAAAEHQLMLLQSQLEPHMLFNTLANLRVLIGLDPARAQAMLDRLIAFLRATLNASRSSLHPLSAEFDRLNDYLALMAVRMGPRLAVNLQLPPELREVPVPPLLLQPLVENCIKHGLEPQVAGGRIDVTARADGQTLVLSVRDTGVGLPALPRPPAEGEGVGTALVRERLAALYGGAASFTLAAAEDAEGGTLAVVQLPRSPTPTP